MNGVQRAVLARWAGRVDGEFAERIDVHAAMDEMREASAHLDVLLGVGQDD
ncbi:hypothetical protein ACFUN8_30260 [Streptomyces sp. NPDC057307]|uniref:hypothetical protein n=1 Tax=Streptomyces sp. NPDC057307 TaxID=3346096 RepID=UPI00363FAD33